MSETPFFFPGQQATLFGVYHHAAAPSRLPFVFCHAFAEEKLWAHRVMVRFARELAALGHPVLRFDYMGNGDSEGEFSESSVETALADIVSAVNFLKARTSTTEVGLLGLRLGATFASRIADTCSDISTLVLWSPIVDGDRYVRDLLRINLTTQMAAYREIRADRDQLINSMRAGETVSIDGYEMAYPLFEQLSRLKLAEGGHSFAGRCLIAQVDRRQNAPAARELDALRALYSNATLHVVQEDSFWAEIDRFYDGAPNLFAATLAWLNER